MNKVVAAGVMALVVACGTAARAQNPTGDLQRNQAAPPTQTTPSAANLNPILLQIQQATSSSSVDIGKLRIEKWKTDSQQKQQLQQISESLQKNIANAIPGLVNDVQSSRGGVLATFKLYHNLNIVYEFLSGLADAAGSLGKKEEYEPLAADAASLDAARQNLSAYIEQAAGRLESSLQHPSGTIPVQSRQTPVPGKKVVVIDEDEAVPKKPKKSTRKKPAPAPPAAPPLGAQTAASPH